MDLIDDVYLMVQIYEECPIYFNTGFLYDDVLRIEMGLKPVDLLINDDEHGDGK